jgi:protein SCO1/2
LRARSRGRRSIGRLLAGFLAVTLTGTALSACGSDPSKGRSYVGVVRAEPLDVADVTLTDVTEPERRGDGVLEGEALRMKGSPDGLLLVYFGFTNCPDVCPTTLADLKVALKSLTQDERDRIDIAFATVDPARDTAEIMNKYTQHFFDRFHVLRGTPEEVEAAASRFLASFTVTGTGTETEVAHTAVLYAVDDTGRVRIEWPFGTDGASIGSDLDGLLEEIGAADVAG